VSHVDQIVDGHPADIHFGFFTGIPARRDMDVIHMHRPDAIIGRNTASGLERLARALSFAVLVKRLRIALVQTVSAADGRAPGSLTSRGTRAILHRVTTGYIVVEGGATAPAGRPVAVVPHGHFRERFLGFPRGHQVQGRVLCIGPDQLSWSVNTVLRVFQLTRTPGLTLRVVGGASTALKRVIDTAISRSPGSVSARIEKISDGSLVVELDEAELVVIPSTEDARDMTLLFVALSLDRPVLMPDTAETRALAEEVGPTWLRRYAGPLTAKTLDLAMEDLRANPPKGRPELDRRDPQRVAAKYAEVFRAASVRRRRR
jgi:beta-1,4-mannosyltransferase